MDMLDFKKVIKELCNSERRELLEMLERSAQSHELTKEIEEARFSAKGIYCPRCGSVDGVVKFGSPPPEGTAVSLQGLRKNLHCHVAFPVSGHSQGSDCLGEVHRVHA